MRTMKEEWRRGCVLILGLVAQLHVSPPSLCCGVWLPILRILRIFRTSGKKDDGLKKGLASPDELSIHADP